MNFALDLHNHSHHSYDCVLSPRWIIERARKRGLNGMAITDHGTIRGGLEMREVNPYEDFLVIVGTEIRTEIGDIVGLFLEKEIRSRTCVDVLKEIHDQGGLVLLPHPGKLPVSLVEPFMKNIDLVEAWNARSKPRWNASALQLAERYKKPMTASSDAHSWFEVGRAQTIVETEGIHTVRRDLCTAPRILLRRRTNFYLSHVASVLTERWKARRS